MESFLEDEICLEIVGKTVLKERSIWRRNIKDENGDGDKLSQYVAGRIPYFYRDPAKIAQDFFEQLNAINAIADLCRKLPTEEHFRCSHFGEILSSLYIQEVLEYKILLRKLTQLTAENTNVHKMDVMCVDTKSNPYKYMWFEVKTCRRHNTVYHRNGIYKQMKDSLEKYKNGDKRFDFVQIKDNISSSDFTSEEMRKVRKDLDPPGPKLTYHGMAVINISTVDAKDEEYLLSQSSAIDYDVRILTLLDLKAVSEEAYGVYENIKKVAEIK